MKNSFRPHETNKIKAESIINFANRLFVSGCELSKDMHMPTNLGLLKELSRQIAFAKKHFKEISSDNVKYGVIEKYEDLMKVVGG